MIYSMYGMQGSVDLPDHDLTSFSGNDSTSVSHQAHPLRCRRDIRTSLTPLFVVRPASMTASR